MERKSIRKEIFHLSDKIKIQGFLYFLLGVLSSSSFCFAQGIWTQKANFGGPSRYSAVGFSIGSKGYIGTGATHWFGPFYKDFWEWDQTTNAWTQKASYGGTTIGGGIGFSIGNKGYIGFGSTNLSALCPCYNDLWEYDPSNNTWTQLPNTGITARSFAFSFTIGAKAYLGTGYDGAYKNDLWEWDQPTNTWTQKSNFGGNSRLLANGFAIGSRGYIGTGWNNPTHYSDFWEWDQTTNTWSQKANFPGPSRAECVSFTIGTYGYMGTGSQHLGTGPCLSDFWQYDQTTNTWNQMANFGGGIRECATGFSIGCNGYVGTGWVNDVPSSIKNDFWEFVPPTGGNPNAIINCSSTSLCLGQSATLTAGGGSNYSWNNGSSSNFITVNPTTTSTYSVIVSNSCGSDTSSVSITIMPKPSASFTSHLIYCSGPLFQFENHSQNSTSWQWIFADGSSTLENPIHLYSNNAITIDTVILVATNPYGCSDSITNQVFVTDSIFTLFIPNAFSPNDDSENDLLLIQGNCFSELLLEIYNRWGEKVFVSTTTNWIQWDGRHMKTGLRLDTGVFTYYLKGKRKGNNEDFHFKGNITLIR